MELRKNKATVVTMSTFEQMSASGTVARVRAVGYDGCRLYLDFRNGQTATVDSHEPFEFDIGSVVLIRPEENHIELAPDELWPEETWVGVVRLKLPDTTVVDSGGRWRMLPTRNDISYREGNTVEVRDSYGVVRVLSEDPIKYVDLPVVDDGVIAKFKSQKGARQETFDDFGGFQHVIDRARELIEVPLKHKDALSKIGARPIKGVLFTGPPGTGKTMLARIIANSTDSVFYEISGPEVFSKWYGQSEEILRKLFEDAAKQEQAIIFFDEIDSVASQRAEESHEASHRVVAQLLTLMDGFTSNDNVVVIAATNRPQDIDAALRRPGRFDWEVNFSLPDRHDRESILRASARRLSTRGTLPHVWVAQYTESWSAAELAAIWSEAALLAVTDGRSEIIAEDYMGGFERVLAQRRRAGWVSPGGNSS
jgi:transitional endoplasmic reticulum ATPase